MKKVYIITFHCALNVGAMLQCYALSEKIKSNGFDVKVIDYRPELVRNESVESIWNARLLKRIIIFIKNQLRSPYHFLKSIVGNDNSIYVFGGNTTYRFYTFMRDYFHLTNEVFYSEKDLLCFQNEDAVFISGSDQVWNFALSESPQAYLLDFVKCGSKNSYAASFGKNTIDERYIHFFKDSLTSFNSITVRENSGVNIVKEISGIDATWVLDPVFLLSKEQWEKLTFRPRIKSPYVFLYRIEDNPVFIKHIMRLKKDNPDIKVVQFDTITSEVNADYQCIQSGPIDFLSYLFYSDIVLTNSFHGAAFSIIAEKKAIIIPHSIYNERISSLMNVMNKSCIDGFYSANFACESLPLDLIVRSKEVLASICSTDSKHNN